jgi:uncharacterized protein (DUF305 family)
MKVTVCALVLMGTAAFPASAQQPMPGMAMRGSGDAGGNPSKTQAFKAANDKMMQGMGVPMTRDADRDFGATMIPHRQGAVDVARVEQQ